MTFVLPPQSTKKHQQLNKNDLSGTIAQSRNINLDEEGYIKLAHPTFAQFTTDDDTDFSGSDAMYPMDGTLYLNSDEVFSGDLDMGNLTNNSSDTNAPSPGVEDDLVFFNQTEVVSDATNIKYRSASTVWTTVSLTGFTTGPVAMTVWGAENSLAVGRGNLVKFINTSWAVNATTLTLPNEYRVSSLASNGSQLYIATRSDSGGEAMLFVVNTIASSADAMYSCGTFEIASIKTFKSSIVAITSLGQLLRFNGGGFTELASLPIYASSEEWCDALNDYSTVSNRAMVVDGDLIYINLYSGREDEKFIANFPSGIWCYDDTSKSLYHRYAASYSRVLELNGSSITPDASTNIFTSGITLTGCMTGMPVLYNTGTVGIPELRDSTCYFLIYLTSTTFKLASTYANAVTGTAIDISGIGDSTQDIFIIRTNDYGWSLYDRNRMTIAVLNSQTFAASRTGRVALTAELFAKQDTTTTKTVFGGTCPFIPNRGYFITPKFESQNIEDTWQKLYVKHEPLKTEDKIIVKYKAKKTLTFPINSTTGRSVVTHKATWTDTDTFTTTLDMSAVEVGDEVEIISGVGSGHIAHISSISSLSGNYTVNLDDAFPFAVASDVFYFMVDKWTKLETIDSTSPTNLDGFFEIGLADKNGLPINSKFIQFKVEMRGIEVTIEELQVSNQGNKYTSVYN